MTTSGSEPATLGAPWTPQHGTPPRSSSSPRKTPDVRAVLTILLEEEGYRVLEAPDGQDALDFARSQHVNLILLDLGMPRLNGEAFCRTYRERDGRAPVILITADHGKHVATTIAACGAAAYITKPFEVDALLEAIERHAARPA